MQLEPNIHRLLIGKIAFRAFKANNQAILSEASSTEGSHTLDGFELEEILGFALVSCNIHNFG